MYHRLACAVLCVLAVNAHAGTPIQESRPLAARGELTIDNLRGRIQVRAWDRDEVRIEGTLGEGVERLDITGDASDLAVRVRYPRRAGGMGVFKGADRSEPTELRLTVPRRVSLAIDSVSADVDVEGVAGGELAIDAVSGSVRAVGAPSDADIETVSGDIMATLNSPKVDIDSVSGDLVLRGRLDGEVSVETVAGDVDIDVHDAVRVRSLKAAAVSGDVRVRAALAAGGAMEFETVSGDVTLQLPRTTSTRVEASSFSGSLSATGARVDTPQRGPGRSIDHRYGSGDGRIEIETFSGDARVVLE